MEIIPLFVLLIFSVILHEVAHGLVALKFGDDTAYRYGRLTLNPVPHMDLMGSVILPAILIFTHSPFFIGWAKPVPINPNRFTHYRAGVIWVSLAGPLTNLALAVLFTLVLMFTASHAAGVAGEFPFLPSILAQTIYLNLALTFFNLVPIPPLDGSKVLSVLLPPELSARFDAIEPYGFMILVFLLATGILGSILHPMVSGFFNLLMNVAGA